MDSLKTEKLSFEQTYKNIVSSPEIEQLFVSHLDSCYSLENLQFLQEAAEYEQVRALFCRAALSVKFVNGKFGQFGASILKVA